MRDNGAAAGNYDAEWTAAIRYYSGWNGINNARNHFYGDQVMERKARLEAEIRTLDAGLETRNSSNKPSHLMT